MSNRWSPDTHPGYHFDVEVVDFDTPDEHGHDHGFRAIRAYLGDDQLPYPQAVLDSIHAENRLWNVCRRRIIEMLPVGMKKPVLDTDGDFVLDDGSPRLAIKDKHRITCDFGGADGHIEIKLPTATPKYERGVIAAAMQESYGGRVTIK